MTPQELRREYAGRDADGDLCHTIHVITASKLLENKDRQIKQLEQERDQLKAAVSMAVDAFQKYEMDVDTYPTTEHVRMMNQLNAVMAKHDAEVIESALYDLSTSIRYDFTGVYSLDSVEEFIDSYINQLRQKAQE